MQQPHIHTTTIAGILTLLLWAAAPARGQFQVAEPGAPGPNTPAATTQAWDRRPGVELYGNTQNKPARYTPQVQPLPSETRMAIERSGALPSEIRMNAAAAGPLTPNGAMDYVPALSPLQQAMGVAPPVLWGPAWQKPLPPSATADGRTTPVPLDGAAVRAPGVATPGGGIRSQLEVTPGPIVQQPVDGRVQTSPLGPVTRVDSTVNRPLIRLRPATTQPTTMPSLSEQNPFEQSK
jgi:hypothetical protein